MYRDEKISVEAYGVRLETKMLQLINNFLLEWIHKDEKCSTKQDSNLHPSVFSWVPLPLDHLHYFLFPSFSS